jgi:hypothetical protein
VVSDNSSGKVPKQPEGPSKGGLNFESFSVTMGAYLKSFAKSPKNPCLPEYDFALAYFEAVINQHEGKLDIAKDCIKKARDIYKKQVKKIKMKEIEEQLHEHIERMLNFLECRQEMLLGSPSNLQASLRRLP